MRYKIELSLHIYSFITIQYQNTHNLPKKTTCNRQSTYFKDSKDFSNNEVLSSGK